MIRFSSIPLVAGLVVLLASSDPTRALAHEGLDRDIHESSEAIRKQPDQFEHHLRRGQLLRLAGRLHESLHDLEHARRLAPHDPRVLLQSGITLAALGRTERAQKALAACLEHGGRWARTYAELAKVLAKRGDRAAAVAAYRESLKLKPDVDNYLSFGDLLESLQRVDEARAVYRTGAAQTRAELLTLALIRLQLASGHSEAALELVDQSLRDAPVKTSWLLRRAQVLDVAGDPRLARATRQAALREAQRVAREHESGMAYTQRAQVYLELGFHAAARRDVERALQLSPRYAAALELSQILERQSLPRGTP
jgi:tetratricopeptide (TPR) repeat protein